MPKGATGIGFALIVAPVIGYLRPDLMPAVLLMLMVPMNCYVAWRDWRSIDRFGAGWVTSGRLLGTFGGLAVLALLPATALNQTIGVCIILAVIASLRAPVFAPGHKAYIAAGLVTGVTETATGVGGPPLALVYQHHQPHVLRPTIALCFLAGELLSLGFLAASRTRGRGAGAVRVSPASRDRRRHRRKPPGTWPHRRAAPQTDRSCLRLRLRRSPRSSLSAGRCKHSCGLRTW